MTLGPVQIVVFGFERPPAATEVARELERLREHDTLRLIDAVVLTKAQDGSVEIHEYEGASAGETVLALLGGEGPSADEPAPTDATPDADTWYLDDAIPAGTTAVIGIVEHRWAVPLRQAIGDAGGVHLADAWVHPSDLASVGLAPADEASVL